ncbi:MAG: S-formylglutathione hydrolase [Limimaricola sp.]|uniref:S-formylglutathione hydrolase n=1 Tax=Limimaricola sp. TaxID=2211665 RepID=UPI001DA3BE51|nr:S-formylglutathione hydrolase [Limimaricola sp.]MBI1418737.1 S-formylglutathione hydrolase [Limimaricola sp.]
MKTISENRCFGGVQGVYSHASDACGCDMTFGLFLPPAAEHRAVPLLWFLAGLTCTHENAMLKAGAQGWAAEAGIALVFPDTSPRGAGIANAEDFALGQGAGFYLNATQAPWAPNYNMWDYVTDELPRIITAAFAVDEERQSVTGHSMGGHGALTMAMGMPGRFRSVSAFSPICNPTQSDWGRPQFEAYLGSVQAGESHDASLLMTHYGFEGPLLIDTGTRDPFASLLGTPAMAEAMATRGQPGQLRLQGGYDHSYFFVASFMRDHIALHAEALRA